MILTGNRIIKESICESRGLSECSFFAQDLYKRLITYADDYGRFNADPQIMLARLYPRELDIVTQKDVNDAICELVGVGKIQFYTSTARRGVYGCFPNWKDHQRLRESKTKCPDPDDTTVNDWYLQRFISIDKRIEIIERDGFKCQICKKFITSDRDAKRLVKHGAGMYHIDHIVPVNQGGRATLENLRLTCPECNLSRKKRFDFQEILDFAANRGKLPQGAANRGKLRPESESEIESEFKSEYEINPSIPLPPSLPDGAQKGQRWDGWMDYADARTYFAQQFDLQHAEERYDNRAGLVMYMAQALAEVVSDPSPTVKVSNQSVPKNRFLQLTADHAAYVAESVAAQEGKIRNPRSYLLTALYRAPDTMGLRNSQGKQTRGKKTAEQTARNAEQAAKQTQWLQGFLAEYGKETAEDG